MSKHGRKKRKEIKVFDLCVLVGAGLLILYVFSILLHVLESVL